MNAIKESGLDFIIEENIVEELTELREFSSLIGEVTLTLSAGLYLFSILTGFLGMNFVGPHYELHLFIKKYILTQNRLLVFSILYIGVSTLISVYIRKLVYLYYNPSVAIKETVSSSLYVDTENNETLFIWSNETGYTSLKGKVTDNTVQLDASSWKTFETMRDVQSYYEMYTFVKEPSTNYKYQLKNIN